MTVKVRERILLHLLEHPFADEPAPAECTIGGMCEALDTTRQYATVELRFLYSLGHVDYRVMRIRDGKRKKRAYALTPLGKQALSAVGG